MHKEQKQRMTFSTKAGTLLALRPVLMSAKVLPAYVFTVGAYEANKKKIISEIQHQLSGELVIVRSSSKSEDGSDRSNAGHFTSVGNVKKSDEAALMGAIDEVVGSYDTEDADHEVLVQTMLTDIRSCGVAFTADITTLAPYYVINFDEGGSTDAITSGSSGSYKTYIHFKHSPKPSQHPDIARLITTLQELEELFDHKFLDVEFAFTQDGELYVLQVRPIVRGGKEDLSRLDLSEPLLRIHKKIEKLSSPHPNLLGDQALYGVMPDWNPAEIIGVKPKALAASLYKEIITDNIWAYQRDNYGYRNLRSHPLKILYLGVPYIDVRVDFNSFIPKALDERIAAKLVEAYLEKLRLYPTLHDKVEFEIVHSCFAFDLPKKLREEYSKDFSEEEIVQIEDALRELTNAIVDTEHGLYREDMKKIEVLKSRYEEIVRSELSTIEKIYWLVEDCKRYGTLPFAGIARSAFVATQFLKSFVSLGIITLEEHERFTNSFNTVTKGLHRDLSAYTAGNMDKEEFLEKYGHLRPGTYDILSPRYDENFDGYFSAMEGAKMDHSDFAFSESQLEAIDLFLKQHGLRTTAQKLIQFIVEAIEGREYAKFVFTKSLSQSLKLIESLATTYGVERDDLPYLDIKTILGLYATLDHRSLNEIFGSDIAKNKESHMYTKAVRLPPLITHPDDVYFHFIHPEEPNFVTLNAVTAPVVPESALYDSELESKIVFIQSADPGYDFLFTKKIGGLVTLFGGANSHMAVRCAELGIPAVIGAGEKNYEEWSKASVLSIDCLNKQVKIIS